MHYLEIAGPDHSDCHATATEKCTADQVGYFVSASSSVVTGTFIERVVFTLRDTEEQPNMVACQTANSLRESV